MSDKPFEFQGSGAPDDVPPPDPSSSDPSEAGSAPRRVSRLCKRDGRVVAYDPERIRTAVERAQAAVGEADTQFPREVEEVVGLALVNRYMRLEALAAQGREERPIPGVEEIQDMVECALIEMGRARLAKAYILYRDRRARARSVLEVVPNANAQPGRVPLVKRSDGNQSWSQAPIVAALMDEAELPRELAETVAERTEKRVLDAGLRYVSTSLVRELVDNELLAMGLAGALHRQEQVGIPRHDLRRLFQTPRVTERDDRADFLPYRGGFTLPGVAAQVLPAASPSGAVAAEVLTRFAYDDVLDEASAESHRAGDLHFEDLARPHCALVRSVPVELMLTGEPSSDTAYALLPDLAGVLRSTSYGVVLEDISVLVAAFLRERDADGLVRFLRALVALAAGTGRFIGLSGIGGRAPSARRSAVRALLAACAELAVSGCDVPRVFASWTELEPVLVDAPGDAKDEQACVHAELLLTRGDLVPVWPGALQGEDYWVAPGCRRGRREQMALACGGAVALNLPRLARRAGAWREDLLLEAAAQTIEACIDGLGRLADFQRDAARSRAESLRERVGFAVTPVGLRESLRILGDGEERIEQGARLLGLLSEAVRRYAEPRGIPVVLSPFFGARARRRMASLDRLGAGSSSHRQPRLFSDLPSPEVAGEEHYSSGFQTSSLRGLEHPGVLDARLFSTVPSGALFPLPASFLAHLEGAVPAAGRALLNRPAGGECAALDAWRRFDALRAPRVPRRSSEGVHPGGSGSANPIDPGPLFRTPPSA